VDSLSFPPHFFSLPPVFLSVLVVGVFHNTAFFTVRERLLTLSWRRLPLPPPVSVPRYRCHLADPVFGKILG